MTKDILGVAAAKQWDYAEINEHVIIRGAVAAVTPVRNSMLFGVLFPCMFAVKYHTFERPDYNGL